MEDLWQRKDTLKVAIQTIDVCNNGCRYCPYPITYHSHKQMSDDTFVKVVQDLKEYMTYYNHKIIKFDFFLQNEPLMDTNLFKRIKFIRKSLPGVKVEVSSNGLLVPKYEQELIDNVEYHFYNISGWDAKSYNAVHNVNITQAKFEEIMTSVERIKSKFEKGFAIITKFPPTNKPVNEWYKRDYSRGGILSNEKIYHDKLEGCFWKKNRFWNILYDGSIVLCFQDWRRQTIMGNINNQSLVNISKTELYNKYMDKCEGTINSEHDFICKKCELAQGDSKFVEENDEWKPGVVLD